MSSSICKSCGHEITWHGDMAGHCYTCNWEPWDTYLGLFNIQQEYKNGCDEPGEYPHDRGIARASDEIERALLYDIDDTMERLSRLCTMPTNGYWAAVVVEGLSIANDSVCGYRQNEYVGNPDWRSDILTRCFAHTDFAVRYEALQLAETWPEEGVSVLQQVSDDDKTLYECT